MSSANRTVERSTAKTSTATIIKMTDWSPIREPPLAAAAAAAAVIRMDSTSRVERRSPVISNLDEARQMIAKLTERNNAQGHLLQAWKQRLKQQNEMLFGLHREREEQMRLLTSQLLLLEANLRAKQGKIDGLLNQRDRIISGHQETIRTLERELDRFRANCVPSVEQQQTVVAAAAQRPQSLPLVVTSSSNGGTEGHQMSESAPESTMTPTERNHSQGSSREVRVLGREQGDESLDDSDSAVVIDDDHRHSPTFAQNSQVRVIRSISDVVDSTRANLSLFREKQQQQKQPGILKSTRLVRNHQRRVMFLQPEEPEVEEQEEEELEEDGSVGSSSSDDSPFNKRGHKTFLRGSFERMPIHQDSSGSRGSGLSSSSLRLNAANCSNHRSVTRPRDVKFKKNNKCSTSWKPSPVDGHGCSPTATTIVTASGNLEFQTSFSHQV